MHKVQGFIFLLVIIFIIALAFRFYNLSNFPVGFHIDEASLGYNAYSFLLTGKDDNNHARPLYIDIFGDNRPSGYHYIDIIPVKLFGLTEFATRFPSAFFGALSIFSIFYLTFVLFRNKYVGLLSAFLLAIAPWHVVLSRASAETIVALFFVLTGFSLLFAGIAAKKNILLLAGALCVCISFFFYHTPRVFVPLLFFILLIFLYNRWIVKTTRQFKIALVGSFLFVSAVAFCLVFLTSGGTGRFSQVNIFGFPETRLVLEEQIREDGTNNVSLINTRIAHNKIVNYSLTFISNYFEYFTGQFLFISGGKPIWYQVPNIGLFYLIELPFILYGLLSLAKEKNAWFKIPLIWLLVAPVVASFTVDDVPNIQRAIVMFPTVEIIAAAGFIKYLEKRQTIVKSTVIIISIFLLTYNIFYFLHQYFVHTKTHRTWYRNNGQKELVEVIKNAYDKYDKIIITKSTGGIYPVILFYMQYDPSIYQREGSPKDKEYSGFGKFYFVPQECPSITRDDRFPKTTNAIYIDNGTCPDQGVNTKDIHREDGTTAFHVVYDKLP